jgi:hypothetical protein
LTQTTRPLKKKVFYAVSFALVLVVLAAVFSVGLERQNAPYTSGNSQPNVEITNFSVTSGWGCLGGLTMVSDFNLTVENKGTDNVTGLVLSVKMFHNGSEVQVGDYFNGTYENGTIKEPLNAGEVREFNGAIMSTVSDEAYRSLGLNDTYLAAYVTLDNNILDQQRNV